MNTMTHMPLGDLLAGHARLMAGAPHRPVTAITADSRTVQAGDLFVAIPGAHADGTRFIADAIARGAGAVLMEPTACAPALPEGVALAFCLNARASLAILAARRFPRQSGAIAAVTGTAGKTSVAYFLRHIWAALGHRAAYLGTLGLVSPSETRSGGLTSPDPMNLHATLQQLASAGVTHVALEASSHGLDQHRLDGVRLMAGGFTNLGRDHLDYHPTPQAYYRAKLRLFTELLPPHAPAVALLEAPFGAATLAFARTRGLPTFAIGPGGDLDVRAITPNGLNQTLTITDHAPIQLPLMGRFQADNALLAAGLAQVCGAPRAAVLDTLATLPGVPGRLQRVGTDPDRTVFVDYAHKPEALAAVLETLRPAVRGRLVVVFGCGGDRDPGKRPLMGQIACRLADVVIITDDNPRSESPAAIRAQILAAAPGAVEIGERAEAIRAAVAGLATGDVLVVAGKGHETGQIIGERTLAFSDEEAVATALAQS